MRPTALSRLAVAGGLVGLATAVLLALLPLRGHGLTGNAVLPRYSAFGWFATSEPVPAHPTTADMRRAGVVFPQDLVRSRRHLVAAVGATGLAATALGLLIGRRPDDLGVEGAEPWAS